MAARAGLSQSPVAPAVCRQVLTQLEAAHAACSRLKRGDDVEALHDFRVALRRLRSLLRAYRPWLGRVPRKLRRQLRTLARATNVARDTEVMLEWLRLEARRKIRGHHRHGYRWLLNQLEERYAAAGAEIAREAPEEFAGVEKRLKAFLVSRARPPRSQRPIAYATVTADLIRQHVSELNKRLADIGSIEEADAIHAARIRGKRLRYLVEPLVDDVPAAKTMVRRMKRFQDRFGVLCDVFVQARELAAAVEIAGAAVARGRLKTALDGERPDAAVQQALPGLIELARRLKAETRRRYAVVERHYLGERSARFLLPFEALAETLAARRP